jgi:sRNA-binding regulator protein Hfq
MSSHAILSSVQEQSTALPEPLERVSQIHSSPIRARRSSPASASSHFPAQSIADEGGYHQAEMFYLQKQIQSQTPMVVVLEDGEHVEGCIEWYDRHCLKIRGRKKTMVYKPAIKYMYKLGEQGN